MSVNKQSAGGSDKIDIIVARPRVLDASLSAKGVFDLVHTVAETGEVNHQRVENSILYGFITRCFAGLVGTISATNDLATGAGASAAGGNPRTTLASGSTAAVGLNVIGLGFRLSSSNSGAGVPAVAPGKYVRLTDPNAANYQTAAPIQPAPDGGGVTAVFVANDIITNTEDTANDLVYADAAGGDSGDPLGIFNGKLITGEAGVATSFSIASHTCTIKRTGSAAATTVNSILIVDPEGSTDGTSVGAGSTPGGGSAGLREMTALAGVQVGGSATAAMSAIPLSENDTLAITYTLTFTAT